MFKMFCVPQFWLKREMKGFLFPSVSVSGGSFLITSKSGNNRLKFFKTTILMPSSIFVLKRIRPKIGISPEFCPALN